MSALFHFPAHYAPPQMSAAGQPLGGQTATGQPVIVQYVNPPNFGPRPVNMHCPHCQCQIRTQTDSEPGPMAWILAGVLCIVGYVVCRYGILTGLFKTFFNS